MKNLPIESTVMPAGVRQERRRVACQPLDAGAFHLPARSVGNPRVGARPGIHRARVWTTEIVDRSRSSRAMLPWFEAEQLPHLGPDAEWRRAADRGRPGRLPTESGEV